MTSASDPGKPRPERMTYTDIRASGAAYRSLPRDVRYAILRGQLPKDPRQRGISHEWARGYRFVAPVQILIALIIAVIWFSVPAQPGLHWARIFGALSLLSVLGPVRALFSARRVLKADRDPQIG